MLIQLGAPIAAADGTDYEVASNGRRWRVRVREFEKIAANAPVNGQPAVAPAGVSLLVSVALLATGGSVATNAAGELMIFAASSLTFQREQLAKPDLDVDALILAKIEEQIADAERQIEGKRNYARAVSRWTRREA